VLQGEVISSVLDQRSIIGPWYGWYEDHAMCVWTYYGPRGDRGISYTHETVYLLAEMPDSPLPKSLLAQLAKRRMQER
jgi:hypothetical protein